MNVANESLTACRVTLEGQVQGVGLRPAVARLAERLGLSGTVRNVTEGVDVSVEGERSQVDEFQRLLPECLPSEARLTAATWESCPPSGERRFDIIDSGITGPPTTSIPPDRATCDCCLREVATESDRRGGYAFTNCTDCGPRYSIIDAMPYDRERTSMRDFSLCARCRNEFTDSCDRRFHAQANACPDCGPALWLKASPARDAALWELLAKALRTGKIVALRGLGGYQLAVDATNAKAVQRLRLRKRRPSKPLAVMVRSLEQAESYASLTDQHRRLLSSSERPIVLVPVKDRIPLCGEVHPGLHEVGLFLPTTALHWLLLDQVQRPLVVTSGNVDGDPLSVTPKEAERQLKGIADLWLHHNRDIAHAIDDSVVRSIADRSVTIRCARGAAPLPLKSVNEFATRSVELRANTAGLDVSAPPVLAVGGHQKGAIALFNGAQAVLGPHIGDLDSLPARERFDEHVRQMWDLYRCEPRRIVHDLHPDYFTTCWAQSSGYPTLAVQHHHAHVVSGMVEMGWLDREVIGVAFDGTGYGIDGTVWGGEFLRATVEGFQRVGHLRPFHLPGGETAIRQPWRVAASLIVAAVGEVQTRQVLKSIGVDDTEAMAVLRLIKNKRLSPVTSSAGRLFDGVAAIALGVVSADNEGQPAMLLESAADPMVEASYEFSILGTKPFQLDWTPMIKQLLDDRQAGLPLEVMAAKFHNGLARAIVKVCSRFRLPIILSGGVFQNRLLTEHVVEELADSRQPLGLHQEIPPNDGGLAAGQLAVGLARFAGAHQRRPCAFEGVR